MLIYPEVGPRLGHLQLPVVLPPGEALETEHLPGVIETCFMRRNGPWPGSQVLRPAVLLGQKQVAVGCAWVKGQGAPVCNDTEETDVKIFHVLLKRMQEKPGNCINNTQALRPPFTPGWHGAAGLGTTARIGLLS